MLQPERMLFTSVFCSKKRVDSALEALSSFGEFHIEEAASDQNHAEYNQTFQGTEEAFSNINEIDRRLISEKTSLLDIFKPPETTKKVVRVENRQQLLETTAQQIITLKQQVDDITASQSSLQEKEAQLNRLQNMLTIISNMGADLSAIEELKLIRVEIASVPHKNFFGLETALAAYPVILNRCYLSKDTDFALIAMPIKYQDEMQRILRIHHADIFSVPEGLPHDTTKALQEANRRLDANKKEERKVLAQLQKVSDENRCNLAAWREIVENISTLAQAKKRIGESEMLATVQGYAPKKRLPELQRKIDGLLEGKALILSTETQPTQTAEPPTKFSHSRLVKPFEEITKLYGLPKYNELDPTPLIAISFPLIFGLMFGDVGHGLLLLVSGLVLGKTVRRSQTVKNMGWILAACGVGAIMAGALYGEFFGIALFKPLWFSPFDNVLMFLIFSLFVGVVQIMSGIVLELANFAVKKQPADILFTSIPKIAFYAGAVYLIAVFELNLAVWFTGPVLLVIVPFLVLVFAKPLFLAIQRFSLTAVEPEGEQNSLGERLFESGDLVTRLLSNTISYARILALLMAHWALILVVYTIVGLIGTSSILTLIVSGVIVVGGNIFVLALEGLIVFIHTLRLHFYEWFSKFYQGTGTPFQPFKQRHVYSEVIKQKQER